MSEDDKLSNVFSKLSKRELSAYNWIVTTKQPKVAQSKSDEFFQLFLNGKSCDEIARLNKPFTLAQVVRCRVDDDWDERRDRHLAELLENARSVVQQRQMEGIMFLTDYMAAFHKVFGDKLKKYVQTSDPAHLENMPFNFKQYKDILELMLKLTGQDKNQKVQGEVLHKHTVEQPVPVEATTLTPEQAAQVLQIIDGKDKK